MHIYGPIMGRRTLLYIYLLYIKNNVRKATLITEKFNTT